MAAVAIDTIPVILRSQQAVMSEKRMSSGSPHSGRRTKRRTDVIDTDSDSSVADTDSDSVSVADTDSDSVADADSSAEGGQAPGPDDLYEQENEMENEEDMMELSQGARRMSIGLPLNYDQLRADLKGKSISVEELCPEFFPPAAKAFVDRVKAHKFPAYPDKELVLYLLDCHASDVPPDSMGCNINAKASTMQGLKKIYEADNISFYQKELKAEDITILNSGRLYGAASTQNLHKPIRSTMMVRLHTVDTDQRSSTPTILVYLGDKVGVNTPTIAAYVEFKGEILAVGGAPAPDNAKELFNTLSNLGGVTKWQNNNVVLTPARCTPPP